MLTLTLSGLCRTLRAPRLPRAAAGRRAAVALVVTLFAVVARPGPVAAAESARDAVVEAAASFDSGDTAGAARLYETAVDDGLANGHVFYNLGIAYFRLGRPGDAIAAFLAARTYLPRDPDVAANLRFALAQVPDRLEPELPKSVLTALAFWLEHVTPRELAGVTALAAALNFLGLSGSFLWPRWRPARRSFVLALLLPAALGGGLAAQRALTESWGAVRVKEAKVFSGPDDKNTELFALHEGAPFAALERGAQDFVRIELSDGKKGWIAGSEVRIFGAHGR